jgi:hypothetical protein
MSFRNEILALLTPGKPFFVQTKSILFERNAAVCARDKSLVITFATNVRILHDPNLESSFRRARLGSQATL